MIRQVMHLLTGHRTLSVPTHFSRRTEKLLALDCETIQRFIETLERHIREEELSDDGVQYLFITRNNLEKALGGRRNARRISFTVKATG